MFALNQDKERKLYKLFFYVIMACSYIDKHTCIYMHCVWRCCGLVVDFRQDRINQFIEVFLDVVD